MAASFGQQSIPELQHRPDGHHCRGLLPLLLNVLIFVGIYYQREKRVKEARRKDELFELTASSTRDRQQEEQEDWR